MKTSSELEPICPHCSGSMTPAPWGRLSYHCDVCGKHVINPLLGIPVIGGIKQKEPNSQGRRPRTNTKGNMKHETND